MPAVPDDGYLRLLGHVTYDINCLEWLVIEIVRRLDPTTAIELLAGMTSDGISKAAQIEGHASKGGGPTWDARVGGT